MNEKKSNTVTATTATAEYRGRFAPSPTGPLHWGSLFTALASYLDAKQAGGQWFVRIEDLDRERSRSRFVGEYPRVLEQFGLEWDGEIFQQSQRINIYSEKIHELIHSGLAYACACTRAQILAHNQRLGLPLHRYPGLCRDKRLPYANHLLRFRAAAALGPLSDRLQGRFDATLSPESDFILRRKDGTISYDLAVVVDDADMGITDVVRGADLWPKTLEQRHLQQALSLPHPNTLHVPLLTNPGGEKLSKSAHAIGVDPTQAPQQLTRLLTLLKIPLPPALHQAPVREQLDWAIPAWRPSRLKSIKNIDLD